MCIRDSRRPGPRLGEPDEVYSTTPARAPSAEGYRIVWVRSTAKAGRDAASRMARTEAGVAAIDALDLKVAGPRNRLTTRAAVEQAAATALADTRADRWVTFHRRDDNHDLQAGRTRPAQRHDELPGGPDHPLHPAPRHRTRAHRPRCCQRRLLPADHLRP